MLKSSSNMLNHGLAHFDNKDDWLFKIFSVTITNLIHTVDQKLIIKGGVCMPACAKIALYVCSHGICCPCEYTTCSTCHFSEESFRPIWHCIVQLLVGAPEVWRCRIQDVIATRRMAIDWYILVRKRKNKGGESWKIFTEMYFLLFESLLFFLQCFSAPLSF